MTWAIAPPASGSCVRDGPGSSPRRFDAVLADAGIEAVEVRPDAAQIAELEATRTRARRPTRASLFLAGSWLLRQWSHSAR